MNPPNNPPIFSSPFPHFGGPTPPNNPITTPLPPANPQPIAPPAAEINSDIYSKKTDKQKRIYFDPEGLQPISSTGTDTTNQPATTSTNQITSSFGNLTLNNTNPPNSNPTPMTKQTIGTSEYSLSVPATAQCSSLFMRQSVFAIPANNNLYNKSHLPFGSIIQPLAKTTSQSVRI
jgi:hypothetical protein